MYILCSFIYLGLLVCKLCVSETKIFVLCLLTVGYHAIVDLIMLCFHTCSVLTCYSHVESTTYFRVLLAYLFLGLTRLVNSVGFRIKAVRHP